MDKPKLLIVEDEEAIQSQMRWALGDDYEVLPARDRKGALDRLRRETPPLVLLDLGLPPFPRLADEGLRALSEMLLVDPGVKVVVLTGNREKENALKAIGLGAFDYFLKPAEVDELKVVLKRALQMASLERESAVHGEREFREGFEGILGSSPSMLRIFEIARKVGKTDAPVLIEGESGTGKELLARAIHNVSPRKDSPFVAINCGAIPENLLESELFGYEKGAFTGAESQKKGRFEFAAGGTLFLDEIGELSPPLQVKLLRFLQESRIERVGGRQSIPLDTRVIAATNREMKEELEKGRFREDLYYRLGVVSVRIPPLRDREEDVVILAKAFLKTYTGQYRKPVKGFSPEALQAIRAYRWPGNVRELENRVKRAVILSDAGAIAPADLELDLPGGTPDGQSLRQAREEAEMQHVRKALVGNDWNISRAARSLGISRPTLHDLIRKYRLAREG